MRTNKKLLKYSDLHKLVFLDDATGLHNLRSLNAILPEEIAQSRKFAILFIDVDHFKGINDQYGHAAGTAVLGELGKHIRKQVRKNDRVFRYGGDEFVAVLSPCTLATAKTVASRIQESIARQAFLDLHISVTVSIGVSIFPEHAETAPELVDAADMAMYRAKKLSRNRVEVAGGRRQ